MGDAPIDLAPLVLLKAQQDKQLLEAQIAALTAKLNTL
jgi:BMFP domain-containing protein YqiC